MATSIVKAKHSLPDSVNRDFWDPGLPNPQALARAVRAGGDLRNAVEAGGVGRDDVALLGDVLAGSAEGRRDEDDITIFDSTGLAIQDLAIALAAMERVGELSLPTLDLN
ncbi:MAG TPA: hypothetical protein VF236_01275 [Gaiellaceae bacterium]